MYSPFRFLPLLAIIFFVTSNIWSQDLKLTEYARGLRKPVDLVFAPQADDVRMFVVEKDGLIQIINPNGTKLSAPFLNIDPKVNSSANERGLLGMCFDPNYANNGYFYVNYTNTNGNTNISRFTKSASNANLANPDSELVLMTINQPFNNHNAGDISFGPDGMLYIGTGDGGSGGDPGNRSQNPKDLLGKMLRIDVNNITTKYKIPTDNPYINNSDTLPEIWAIGLRNPWRFSFDNLEKTLWIADVGQDKWEEINKVSAAEAKINYGWRCFEGKETFNRSGCKAASEYLPPIYQYANKFDIGCSITGGYVYRGTRFPNLYGKYIYCDYCTGLFWALYQGTDGVWVNDLLFDGDDKDFATFGEDNKGELYVAGLETGVIFKVGDSTTSTGDLQKPTAFNLAVLTNPVDDLLKINITSQKVDKAHLKLIDLKGKLIKDLGTLNTNSIHEINISAMGSGIYLIISPQDENIAVKVVKM